MASERASKKPASDKTQAKGFTKAEVAAMREHAQELRASARRAKGGPKEDPEVAVLAKIATFPEPDRSKAKRIHALVKASAPGLSMRLWYGMPAYTKNDEIVCFFQNASKFGARYATLGFNDEAKLDEGEMWPISYALMDFTEADEARIRALVAKAFA